MLCADQYLTTISTITLSSTPEGNRAGPVSSEKPSQTLGFPEADSGQPSSGTVRLSLPC